MGNSSILCSSSSICCVASQLLQSLNLAWTVRFRFNSGLTLHCKRIHLILTNNYNTMIEASSPYEQRVIDLTFVRIAQDVAQRSKDPSTKTGAVITTPEGEIITGYNSFPLMMKQDPELYADREVKYSRMVHCEVRALNSSDCDVRGGTLYTWPFMSCDRCFVQMLDAGITRFVAPKPNADQLTRWGDAFVKVRQYAQEAGVELVELEFNEDV